MPTLDEVLVQGKPYILQTGSENAAIQMAEEVAIKRGVDPVRIDLEFTSVDDVKARMAALPSGAFVIASDSDRIDEASARELESCLQDISKDSTFIMTSGYGDRRGKNRERVIKLQAVTDAGGHVLQF